MTCACSLPGQITAGANILDKGSGFPDGAMETKDDGPNAFGFVLTQIAADAVSGQRASKLSGSQVVAGSEERRDETTGALAWPFFETPKGDRSGRTFRIIPESDAATEPEKDNEKCIPEKSPDNMTGATLCLPHLAAPQPDPDPDPGLAPARPCEAADMDAASADPGPETSLGFLEGQSGLPAGKISVIAIETHLPPLIMRASRENLPGMNEAVVGGILPDGRQINVSPIRILKLVLHPVELGALTIRIRMSGGGLQVEIRTETDAAATRLFHVREKMLDNLSDAGAGIAEGDLTIGIAPPLQRDDQPKAMHYSDESASGPNDRRGASADRQPKRKEHESPDEKAGSPDSPRPLCGPPFGGVFV